MAKSASKRLAGADGKKGLSRSASGAMRTALMPIAASAGRKRTPAQAGPQVRGAGAKIAAVGSSVTRWKVGDT
ncbi:hypothetical protein, partial [Rhodomicrobium vannielii]|uniref:hypothetical protein n=1 Tax=Rhodomicrobium vannielii TaxID=1069 RepID=UPI001AEE1358